MENLINRDWKDRLHEELEKDYFNELNTFIDKEYDEHTIFPPREDIFNALNYTSYKDARVVIIGQDPYHGDGQAEGLCFSVKSDVKIPPSLRNIYKEIHNDLGIDIPSHGSLVKWARQGVLLLNTVLTVRAHEANSHRKKGWERFTDSIIEMLDKKEEPMVFILWGNPAKKKKNLINNPRHLVLEAAHPSPLSASRGFFGCNHFSMTNDFLKKNGLKEIDWSID